MNALDNQNGQWDLEKVKPDPNGTPAQIRAYLDMNATDKKAIVLNKLNFQNESNISSEQNFNQFFYHRCNC
jgi:hypothetical protein